MLTIMGAALHIRQPVAHSKLIGAGSQFPIGQHQVISRVIIKVSTQAAGCIFITSCQIHPNCTRKVKGDL